MWVRKVCRRGRWVDIPILEGTLLGLGSWVCRHRHQRFPGYLCRRGSHWGIRCCCGIYKQPLWVICGGNVRQCNNRCTLSSKHLVLREAWCSGGLSCNCLVGMGFLLLQAAGHIVAYIGFQVRSEDRCIVGRDRVVRSYKSHPRVSRLSGCRSLACKSCFWGS